MTICRSRKLLGKRTSLLCMFVLTSTLFVTEIVVGYLTNSTALIADSFHMLSDVLSIIIGFVAVTYSQKHSKYNTYGWVRAEVLGALSNAVFLLALCFTIIVSGIQRLVEVETIDNPILILIVGSVGLVINLIGLLLFHGHAHGHHHGEDKDEVHHHDRVQIDDEHQVNKEEESEQSIENAERSGQLNMRGVFLHVLGDALGSLVVIGSALTIYFATGQWRYYVDPFMSLVIAGIIVWTTVPLLKRSALILLQTPPSHIKKEEILRKVKKISGIQSIHELHVWQLSGCCVIASAHVAMHNEDNFNETAMKVIQIFHDKGIHSVTLQPEFYDCKEGQSICGLSSCYYLNKDKSLTTPRVQDTYEDPCLLSCVSKQCGEFQCCNGLRQRQSTCTLELTDGQENESFSVV